MADETGIVLPYEKLAIVGEEMPDGLAFPDQIMFLSLRALYWQHKSGIIERETAIKEKRKLLKEYEINQAYQEAYKSYIEQVKKTELAKAKYRKNKTLENADYLVAVMDGME